MRNALLDLTTQLLKKQADIRLQFGTNTEALQAQFALLSAYAGPRGWVEARPVLQAVNSWLAGNFRGKGLDWIYLSHGLFIPTEDGVCLADSDNRMESVLQGLFSWMKKHPQNYYHCYKGLYQSYHLCYLPYVLTHQSSTSPLHRLHDFLQANHVRFLKISQQLGRESEAWVEPHWFDSAQEISKLQKKLELSPAPCEALYEVAVNALGKLPLPTADNNWQWLDSWQFELLRKWYTQTIISRFFGLAGSRLQATGRCATFWNRHWRQVDELKILFKRETQLRNKPELVDLQQLAQGRFEWIEEIRDGAALLIQLGNYTIIEYFDERTPVCIVDTQTNLTVIPALPHRDNAILSWETLFERKLARLVNGFGTT